jgi:hypothetical protein
MAYVIYSSPRKIKIILKHLRAKGLVVEETDLPEYLITIRDPMPYIPAELKKAVRVQEFEGRFAEFLKNAGRIGRLLFGKEFSEGDAVEVKDGMYKGFSGIVKKMKDKLVEVEVSVFGKVIVEEFLPEQLEKIASGSRF